MLVMQQHAKQPHPAHRRRVTAMKSWLCPALKVCIPRIISAISTTVGVHQHPRCHQYHAIVDLFHHGTYHPCTRHSWQLAVALMLISFWSQSCWILGCACRGLYGRYMDECLGTGKILHWITGGVFFSLCRLSKQHLIQMSSIHSCSQYQYSL